MMKKIISLICILLSYQISYSQYNKEKNNNYTDYIGVYQKFISPIKGSSCPMYPSCSNYGILSFRTKNPAVAFISIADRLMRCGHEHELYSLSLQNNKFRLIDFPDSSLFDKKLIYHLNKTAYAFSDTVYPKNKQLEFVKYLINKQYFQQALLEISRLIHSDYKLHQTELYTNYLICLRKLEMQEKGIFEYENSFPSEIKNNPDLLKETANLWLELENYTKANEYYNKALNNTDDFEDKNNLRLQNAFTQIKQQKYDLAFQTYVQISDKSFYHTKAQANISILNELRSIRKKSPAFAGILSIIPGGGYFYSDHKQTAMSALIINSLLIYATYSCVKKENYGMAALTGMFSLSFYIGNIFGAVKSAKRYNKVQTETKVNKIIR